MRNRVLAAGAVGLALVLAGCGGGSTSPAAAPSSAPAEAPRDLTVFAAASLNGTFTAIGTPGNARTADQLVPLALQSI